MGYSENAPKRDDRELKKGTSPLLGTPLQQANTDIIARSMFNMTQLKTAMDKGDVFKMRLFVNRLSAWAKRHGRLNGHKMSHPGHALAQILFAEPPKERPRPEPDPEKVIRLNRKDKKK
ncbi:MAG: hypothetical protein RLZZ283_315 [Candidatus Parcubacteria bacterium]|jgi:hypothetical protein